MKESKKFLRQCVSCREIKSKEEMIRLTKNYKTGEIKVNYNSSCQGRSVYICKNEECIQKAIKKKKIEHFLKSNLTESIKEELSTVLKN